MYEREGQLMDIEKLLSSGQFENLLNICYNDKLKDVPKILETPYVGDSWESKEKKYPPYRFEIAMLREKKFNENLLQSIQEYYNK